MTEDRVNDPERAKRIVAGAEKLREAARLIAQADLEVDGSQSPCGCCGMSIARRHRQWRVHNSLANLPDKLRELAAEMIASKDEPENPQFQSALKDFHAAAQQQEGRRRSAADRREDR